MGRLFPTGDVAWFFKSETLATPGSFTRASALTLHLSGSHGKTDVSFSSPVFTISSFLAVSLHLSPFRTMDEGNMGYI